MSYQASCHCGTVQVEVDAELPEQAVTCNCSHCAQKGLVLAAIPRDRLTVTSGEEALRTYRFNKAVISHRFCSMCGTQPFSEGTGPDGSAMAMINLRCVPAADIGSIETIQFDGASL